MDDSGSRAQIFPVGLFFGLGIGSVEWMKASPQRGRVRLLSMLMNPKQNRCLPHLAFRAPTEFKESVQKLSTVR